MPTFVPPIPNDELSPKRQNSGDNKCPFRAREVFVAIRAKLFIFGALPHMNARHVPDSRFHGFAGCNARHSIWQDMREKFGMNIALPLWQTEYFSREIANLGWR